MHIVRCLRVKLNRYKTKLKRSKDHIHSSESDFICMCYTSFCFGRREKDEHCRHFEEKVQRIADAAPRLARKQWKVSFPLNGTMIFSILILYATSIGAVKSDLWKETTLIEKVNEKSKTIQGWKCNHCETDFWNTNLARLQFHLG